MCAIPLRMRIEHWELTIGQIPVGPSSGSTAVGPMWRHPA
jgi:hypothetical protein